MIKWIYRAHKKFQTGIAIEFNQNAWLKTYIDTNTDLRKKAKNDFEKDFFELMNNAKLVTTERRRNYLDLKSAPGNYFYQTCSTVDAWQCFEYSYYKYVRILNIFFLKYKKRLF